jgi:hypothetical protein
MYLPFTRIAFGACALTALAASTGAHAQTEINQDMALAGSPAVGLFNDPPGFPIMIMKAGHYKLTGNLSVPVETSGIEVHTSGVTIDLNGFSISGSGRCSSDIASYVVTCSGLFGWHGVEFMMPGNTLRNGRVRGFGVGVLFQGADMIEDVLVEHSYFNGLQSPNYRGAATLIRGVRSQLSREDGFNVHAVEIRDSSASRNGGDGFSIGNGMLLDSMAQENKGVGVKGASLVAGRTWAIRNGGGNFTGVVSMGGNINGTAPY